jgi:hypothetical protein
MRSVPRGDAYSLQMFSTFSKPKPRKSRRGFSRITKDRSAPKLRRYSCDGSATLMRGKSSTCRLRIVLLS